MYILKLMRNNQSTRSLSVGRCHCYTNGERQFCCSAYSDNCLIPKVQMCWNQTVILHGRMKPIHGVPLLLSSAREIKFGNIRLLSMYAKVVQDSVIFIPQYDTLTNDSGFYITNWLIFNVTPQTHQLKYDLIII